jgi:hypothetical protein
MNDLIPPRRPCFSVAGNTIIPRLLQRTLGAAVGAVATGLALADSQAQAIIVPVDSKEWDVTTFTGSYNDNASKFNSLENGGLMPWFGDSALASSFASIVSDSLGFLTDYPGQTYPLWGAVLSPAGDVLIPVQGAIGPIFGYGNGGGCDPGICGSAYVDQTGHPWSGSGAVFGKNDVWTWAQATLIGPTGSGDVADVPGPLPALGLAAAFGFSRKLRKRVAPSKTGIFRRDIRPS